MRLVPINCIKPGTYLSRSIYDDSGRVLLAKGVELTSLLLQRIKHHGIFSLYIQDEYSQVEINDIIEPELRQKAIYSVKNYYNFNSKPIEEIKSKESYNTYLKKQKAYLTSIKKIAKDIVEEILNQKDVLINLVDIKSMDNYTYAHCVNVAVLSLVMGMDLGFNKKQLMDLAIGAILHDIGKIFIGEEILNKNGKLTEKEFELVKEHPEKGYEYTKGIGDISAPARIIIYQHHERFNGSGYPQGLKEDKIHIYSKIVAIADVYDALTSHRPYRKALPPNEAIEFIMGTADRDFDYKIAKIFIEKIIPYPIGTLVRLSNGCIGVIQDINPSLPLRPIVKIILGNEKIGEDEVVDLYHNCNIVIEGVQYENPLEEEEEKAL